jgi:hypothetical protein
MHQPAISDRREQDGKRKIEAENAGAQIAIREGNGVARAKSNVVEDAAVFAERNLTFGAAIEVVKYGLRHSLAGDGAEVLDANNPGRCH